MTTKSGNIGNWFVNFDQGELTTPVGKWMRQFQHIRNVTQVDFNTWGDLVGTVTMAGLRISDDKFVGEDFKGEKGIVLYALTYKGQKVGYASEKPMIAVDSEVWK